MKIKRFFMEDWLIESKKIEHNLAESGCEDLYLKDLLELCDVDISSLQKIYLGDNVPWGSLKLRQEICYSYENVLPENLMVANGSSEALFSFFNTLLDKGDEVIMPFPAFQCLYQVPIGIGCQVKFLALEEEDQWKLNLDKLEQLVSPKTKLIIINTPHNPFGWALSEEELLQIADIAKKNDAYLLFDEHYRYLPLLEGTGLLPSGYDVCRRKYDKVYATGSMIKCFGIVGIRIGWLIGDTKMLGHCIDYKDYLTHTIPEITDYLAYIALKNKDKIIAHKKQDILPNLEDLDRFIAKHSNYLKYYRPEGGIICFPKLHDGIDSTKFCEDVLEKHGVSLLPGFTFEMDGYFRINFGVNRQGFINSLRLIEEYIDQIDSH